MQTFASSKTVYQQCILNGGRVTNQKGKEQDSGDRPRNSFSSKWDGEWEHGLVQIFPGMR
jgi:hypothetical protein